MPRTGPRRVLVGTKVLPKTVERLDALAADADAGSRSDIARLGIELTASSTAARRRGACGLHEDRVEDMFVLTLPTGDEIWFCETTQQVTQGVPQG